MERTRLLWLSEELVDGDGMMLYCMFHGHSMMKMEGKNFAVNVILG
jgi:hypothetical protein